MVFLPIWIGEALKALAKFELQFIYHFSIPIKINFAFVGFDVT